MLRTSPTTWLRALVLSVAVLVATAVGATPASAGETGRNCVTYYHHNDPSTGWGFTVCVKLEHDTVRHGWRVNGSMTTSTPGMTLHTAVARLSVSGFGVVEDGSKGPPSATQILGIVTDPWWLCGGTGYFLGWIEAFVTWPNGVRSSITTTETRGSDGLPGSWTFGSC